MKLNLRKLQLIFALTRLKPEMFYTVSVSTYNITLQGQFSGEKVKQFSKLISEPKFDSNGYAIFIRGNINITLTE